MARRLRTGGLMLVLLPAPALAHSGHDGGFVSGVLHPLSGVDHVLAMLMVGLWAGIAFRRHWWIAPGAFVGFMLAGFAYGAAGGAMPFSELLILASLAVPGLAIAFDARPRLAIAAPIVALFAVGHGYAHGAEMTVSQGAGFVAGFLVSTILLHAAGLAIASLIRTRRTAQLAAGSATFAAAAWMWAA